MDNAKSAQQFKECMGYGDYAVFDNDTGLFYVMESGGNTNNISEFSINSKWGIWQLSRSEEFFNGVRHDAANRAITKLSDMVSKNDEVHIEDPDNPGDLRAINTYNFLIFHAAEYGEDNE